MLGLIKRDGRPVEIVPPGKILESVYGIKSQVDRIELDVRDGMYKGRFPPGGCQPAARQFFWRDQPWPGWSAWAFDPVHGRCSDKPDVTPVYLFSKPNHSIALLCRAGAQQAVVRCLEYRIRRRHTATVWLFADNHQRRDFQAIKNVHDILIFHSNTSCGDGLAN